METHGGRDVPQSHIQETRQDNITKTILQVSHSREISQGQTSNTTKDVETPGHVGSEIKKNKEDDQTVPGMGRKGSQ